MGERSKDPILTHLVLVTLVEICRKPIVFAYENEKKKCFQQWLLQTHFTGVIGTISNSSKSHIRRLSKVPLEVGHFGRCCKNQF